MSILAWSSDRLATLDEPNQPTLIPFGPDPSNGMCMAGSSSGDEELNYKKRRKFNATKASKRWSTGSAEVDPKNWTA